MLLPCISKSTFPNPKSTSTKSTKNGLIIITEHKNSTNPCHIAQILQSPHHTSSTKKFTSHHRAQWEGTWRLAREWGCIRVPKGGRGWPVADLLPSAPCPRLFRGPTAADPSSGVSPTPDPLPATLLVVVIAWIDPLRPAESINGEAGVARFEASGLPVGRCNGGGGDCSR